MFVAGQPDHAALGFSPLLKRAFSHCSNTPRHAALSVKILCGLTVVESQQAAQPLAGADPANERAMPPQDSFGPDELGHFAQDLAAKLFAHLGQANAFGVSQSQPPLKLAAENAVLGHQVFVLEYELLIDRAGDECQQSLPGPQRELTQQELRSPSSRRSLSPGKFEVLGLTGKDS